MNKKIEIIKIIIILCAFLSCANFAIANGDIINYADEIKDALFDPNYEENKKIGEEKGIRELEEAISLNPNDSALYFSLVQAYSKQENFKRAIDLLQKAIQLQPHNEEYIPYMAGLYCADGDLDKAIETFKKLDTINPNRGELALELPLKKLISIIDRGSVGVMPLSRKPFEKMWRYRYTKLIRLDMPYVQKETVAKLRNDMETKINLDQQKSNTDRIMSFSQQGNLLRCLMEDGRKGFGLCKDRWFVIFISPVEFGRGYMQNLIWGEIKEKSLVGTDLAKVFSETDPEWNYEHESSFVAEE